MDEIHHHSMDEIWFVERPGDGGKSAKADDGGRMTRAANR
jgi:hypothetical protein